MHFIRLEEKFKDKSELNFVFNHTRQISEDKKQPKKSN